MTTTSDVATTRTKPGRPAIRTGLAVLAVLFGAAAALGQSTPFAEPPPRLGLARSQLSLGNLMSLIQSRHIKLWYAGQARNWALVHYELDHISADLTDSALFYTMIPVELVNATGKPLAAMREAAERDDVATFNAGYMGLTEACNGCHQAGNVGFVRIQTPIASPFTDQDLTGRQNR